MSPETNHQPLRISAWPCRSLLRRLLADALDVPKLGGVRRRPTIRKPLERFDTGIRHAEPTVVMADHGVDAPVPCVLQRLKDRPIERLAHAEHAAFASTDDRAIAGDQFSMLAFLHGQGGTGARHCTQQLPRPQACADSSKMRNYTQTVV
jgi:hypothetical protein